MYGTNVEMGSSQQHCCYLQQAVQNWNFILLLIKSHGEYRSNGMQNIPEADVVSLWKKIKIFWRSLKPLAFLKDRWRWHFGIFCHKSKVDIACQRSGNGRKMIVPCEFTWANPNYEHHMITSFLGNTLHESGRKAGLLSAAYPLWYHETHSRKLENGPLGRS